MRHFFSHWKILLALAAMILLALITLRPHEAGAQPPLAERLRQHALAIASDAGYADAAFAAHGYRVRHQQYGTGSHALSTVEASLTNVAPGARPGRVFIVGSRYDSAPGAPDDDAAAAAAVLELAGLLKHLRPASGTEIRFVLFATRHRASGASDGHAADAIPRPGQSGNFIAFAGTRAASGPVRQALAAFRDDADLLAAGIVTAPCYVQAVTLATDSAASEGAAAVLITDTAFMRYPYFRSPHTEGESEHEGMARVVTALARTLTALAGALST